MNKEIIKNQSESKNDQRKLVPMPGAEKLSELKKQYGKKNK